ncbi:hypothetical protein V2V90_23590 (plasmid) [Agrobacterium leguminum]|uniref:hypothetical protein n=1 Tax=Agrobacterium leguminum TaxID=2792015 RepID=UPI0030D58B00
MATRPNRGNFRNNNAKAGNNSERPDRPAMLGNVALKVESYSTKDNVVTVTGKNVATGAPLTVGLMSAARAANMMKAGIDDERERVETWAQRLANQVSLDKFADPKDEKYYVQPGGVLQLTNVRLDFSDKNYYAQTAFGLVPDPSTKAVLDGTISLQKFENGSMRLQVYQPEAAVALDPADQAKTRAAISAAFDPKSPVGDGQMSRTMMVTVSQPNERGYIDFNTFFARSASYEVGEGEYRLSSNFGDTLDRMTLDKKTGIAIAVLASVAGVPFEKVAARIPEGAEKADVAKTLRDYYDGAKGEGVKVSITPGYTVPFLKAVEEHIAKREEMFANEVFPGVVAVAVRRADGDALERPAATSVMSSKALPKQQPENPPELTKVAERAHRSVHGIEFKRREASAESSQSADKAPEKSREASLNRGPSLDF